MPKATRLVIDRLRPFAVAIADAANADPACKINIFAPLRVKHAHALAAHDRDREAPIGLHDIFLILLADLL